MKQKRILGLVFLALFLTAAAATFAAAPGAAADLLRQDWDHPAALAQNMELFFKDHMPFAPQMRDLYLEVRMLGGNRELDGVFLVEDGLVEKFAPPQPDYGAANTQAILDFVQTGGTPAFLMVVPTASAIYQDRLPANTPLYNQRAYLESLSAELAGSMTVADVYLPLYYARDQYLYYRTSPQLTSLGQLTVYQNLAKRLGFTPRPLEEFVLSRVPAPYYGPLYAQWGYGGVKGDVVTYYRNQVLDRACQVRHWERYEQRTYYSLFPPEAALEGDAAAVILGGLSPRIEITMLGAPGAPTLLVVGDESTVGLLPFLALHYRSITFLDLGLLTDSEIAALPAEGYDHILFAYSLDTYLGTGTPAKIAALGGRGEEG